MANKNKGEVALKAGEKEYILRFSANALCDLESSTGKTIMQIMDGVKNIENLSMTTVRAMLWAGLKEHHPEVTIMDAGNIIGEISMLGAFNKIAEAAQAAFPDAEKDNPQLPDGRQVPAGIGLASSEAGLN